MYYMEDFNSRLKRLEYLSLNPFKPQELMEELEEILKELPNMDIEKIRELNSFLQGLKLRIEENYTICFGWIEKALEKGFKREV